MQAPMLVLKARVEIAEGRFADAVRTLETGLSFSQQVGDGAFLINSLVGIACASQCLDCLTELMEQPKAPNMYWALAVVPRPLNNLRKAYEIEQDMLEMQFPDTADLDRPRTPPEWDRALVNVRKELDRIRKYDRTFTPPAAGSAVTDPASKSPDLEIARKYLAEVMGVKQDVVAAMPPAEVLMRYLVAVYHDMRDDIFKATYLPFPKRKLVIEEAIKRMNAAPDTEACRLARAFLPAIQKVQQADVRIQRRLAILQAIEALRMHTAANNGDLPAKLADLTVVPVLDDPGTGRPFEYQRDGKTAILVSRMPGEVPGYTGLRYRLTVRK